MRVLWYNVRAVETLCDRGRLGFTSRKGVERMSDFNFAEFYSFVQTIVCMLLAYKCGKCNPGNKEKRKNSRPTAR